MNRRDFIGLAAAIGLTPWWGDMAFAQGQAIRIRRNVATAEAAGDVKALSAGVARMKANTQVGAYASWTYWANSHGMPDNVPPDLINVWSQCEHGTRHFITWHRAYLFFFESLIRELTGTSDFALPYWNWYQSTSIPGPYLEKQLDGAANPLHHEPRRFGARRLISAAMRVPDFDSFSGSLEANPHGTVHVMVGGDMGSIETSARDPLFWAHHAQIDRLWSAWIDRDSQRVNPQDDRWRGRAFTFDTKGEKSLTVQAMLETALLGYRYDTLSLTGEPVDETPTRPASSMSLSVPSETLRTLSLPGRLGVPAVIGQKSSLSLDGGSVELKASVPSPAFSSMSTMSAGSVSAPTLTLILEGVRATGAGLQEGAEYRLYLNLPSVADQKYDHDDFYLGAINTFALSHHGEGHSQTYRFSLDALAPRLAKYGLWSSEQLSISLVSDGASSGEPLIQVDNVRLVLSSQIIK